FPLLLEQPGLADIRRALELAPAALAVLELADALLARLGHALLAHLVVVAVLVSLLGRFELLVLVVPPAAGAAAGGTGPRAELADQRRLLGLADAGQAAELVGAAPLLEA